MNITATGFVHLHVHTGYSLLNSTIRIADFIQRVRDLGMGAVAITDDGVMFGVMEFYRLAMKAGIRPIIGCDCYLAPRTIADRTPADQAGLSRLVLLAETMEGYRNLCLLATIAQEKGFYQVPRIDKDLLRQHSRGLIGLSAGAAGEIGQLITRNRPADADVAARQYGDILGQDNFFLEIQITGLPGQAHLNSTLRDMSQRLSLPLAGTNNCRYLVPKESFAHRLLQCLKLGLTIYDPAAPGAETDQLYVRTAEEMGALLADFPRAAANTVAIAERCRVEFECKTRRFPFIPTPAGKTPADLLAEKARSGLTGRWPRILTDNLQGDENRYRLRLEHELEVINRQGLAPYFLIMADLVDYARDNRIMVGPGRGSAPGSLVCFCLGITDIDPLAHGLLFERFQSFIPDIQLDICERGRRQVRRRLLEKYAGANSLESGAAEIISFCASKSRAAVRDMGRVMALPLETIDCLARLVPTHARDLAKTLGQEPALREMTASHLELACLLDAALILKGLPRHISAHGATVAISDKPLIYYMPLYRLDNRPITQFDNRNVEALGLGTLTLLGLRDLTVMADTLALIDRQGKAVPDLSRIDPADPATAQLLAGGDTGGLFQLQSIGMKELLIKARPRSLSDLTVLMALYPGGLQENDMANNYLDRKQGRRPIDYLPGKYPSPEYPSDKNPLAALEPILRETFGLIIYQEQTMMIAQTLAGYTPEESEELRRDFGQKKPATIAAHRQRFILGAVAGGLDEPTARQLFEHLEYFGGYGFNKAHSLAYAWIAWQMAYLKAHFPAEFMAAWKRSER